MRRTSLLRPPSIFVQDLFSSSSAASPSSSSTSSSSSSSTSSPAPSSSPSSSPSSPRSSTSSPRSLSSSSIFVTSINLNRARSVSLAPPLNPPASPNPLAAASSSSSSESLPQKLKNWVVSVSPTANSRASLQVVPVWDGVSDLCHQHLGLEFSDSLIFVELVERLEGPLRGIHRPPKTAAAVLFNVSQALNALKLNKKIPLDYLQSPESIVQGNSIFIHGLLNQLFKVYGSSKVSRRRSVTSP
eukprot:TRINITY_DN9116_c0_g2_i2.p1 TRINITY_DN9116_c0_g2~~TRINITY_DN9116_c0_g2_i2.p1  ORF type:complete len:244 (+),score=57.17 TRINITY_DN9116_c0_g2_i2:67-798(+)